MTRGEPLRATIADVAVAAGVSKATVSRFLNHRERLLSPAIAARVEQAIAALGYSPHPMAQALSHGRTRLIGLVVADIANPYSVAVLRGAERACQAAGYLVMLFNLGPSASANAVDGERAAIEALAGYRVDGFILNTLGGHGTGDGADGLADVLARYGKPAVLVDRRHEALAADLVALDNAGAMRMACAHLRERGYRRLLYVTEPQRAISTRRERVAAFQAFLEAHAGEMTGDVFESEEGDAGGLDNALRMLRREAGDGQRRKRSRATGSAQSSTTETKTTETVGTAGTTGATGTAVIAGNAVVTLRVAAAVARLGWCWGTGLGFIGFDDADWSPLIGPGLSAIAQPTDAIGHAAASHLIDRLRGFDAPPRELRLPATLIPRDSSRRR